MQPQGDFPFLNSGRVLYNRFLNGLAVLPTGGVYPHLPHHLDLASEDSVGHSTCMSVLTLTLTLALSRWGTAESPTHSPATRLHDMYCDQHVAAPRQT